MTKTISISLISQKSSFRILRMRNILSQTRWFRVVLSLLLLSAIHVHAVDYNGILPLPKSIVMSAKQGTYALQPNAVVTYDGRNAELGHIAQMLCTYVAETADFPLTVQADQKRAAITLSLGLKSGNPDAYTLTVSKKGIAICGATPSAVFRGVQSLRKAIGTDGGDVISMPWVSIADEPRFSYRGVHLDCARHFFPLSAVKHYIDILALHGCNQLHWHITDDQGWRFEVKAMPDLTAKASRREHTVIGNNCMSGNGEYIFDDTPEMGFYTQDECREIVRYAAERYINVIPEIDLPGHMVAALSVYPELGCTGGPYEVWPLWGISDDVLCAGNDKTLEFLKTVLGELADVFPSKQIHIGGDECPRTRWENCPKCQAKMRALGMKKAGDLQSYINKELDKFLAQRGRDVIGWDEILEGELSENSIVMSWRGYEGGIEAARKHHRVIMTPTTHCYFDYYQSKERQPLSIGGYVPVSKVYSMEPVPAELTAEESRYILGAQCNLWTEYVLSEDHLQYMLLPRLCAMSEVQWVNPDQKDYTAFTETRLPHMLKIFKKLGYTYSPYVE